MEPFFGDLVDAFFGGFVGAFFLVDVFAVLAAG
jgi:hypothetical protein